MTTPRSPKSPARKALPPIYVVVDHRAPVDDADTGAVASYARRREALYTRQWNRRHRDLFGPFDIVKYLPAPVPPRSRKSKGGGRG